METITAMKLNDSVSFNTSQAAARPLTLAATFFVMGAALTGTWFYLKNPHAFSPGAGLSEQTRSALGHLEAPVTIRFYSVLPAGSAGAELQSFSGRVEQLLAAVQAAGDGKILVKSLSAAVEANVAAAEADGLQPFNLDKGDACFLGLTISNGEHKEAIARLQPEWESALPYDLVRAVQRVAAASAPAPLPREIAKPSAEIISSISRLIPDAGAVSAEQASQIFHAEFLKECVRTGTEMEALVAAAQQQVIQAQGSGSAEDLAAAQKNLRKAELEEGQKLKQVAANLQIRQAVFQQMKASATNSAK